MSHVRIFSALALALMAAAPLSAQSVPTRLTGQAVVAICAENQSACLTYVLGVVDGVSSLTVLGGGRQLICLPPALNNTQLAQTALQMLRARPPQENAAAGTIIITGLRQAYPCPG